MPPQSLPVLHQAYIEVTGARTHNLKNISIKIPRHQLVVFTGPSGSGKSSLAVDTIYAEGQRIYFESINLSSRQFLKQLPAASVDWIAGLPPMVCIDQKFGQKNRRQTVGEVTEINDFLRGMYSVAGQIACHQCGRKISAQSPPEIIQALLGLPEKTKLIVLAPLRYQQETNPQDLIDQVRNDRLVRVRVDGELSDIDQIDASTLTGRPDIEAVTDRLVIRDGCQDRLAEAIEMAIKLSQGAVRISAQVTSTAELTSALRAAETATAAKQSDLDPTAASRQPAAQPNQPDQQWLQFQFQTRLACSVCQLEFQAIHPRLFNFNNPAGACSECDGLGRIENGSTCNHCQGTRLNQQARSVLLEGVDLGAVWQLPVTEVVDFLQRYPIGSLPDRAGDLLVQALQRLEYLCAVGVGYLSLGRGVDTLSGGEHQRVRLTRALGGGLANIGYVLDEPTIGLHPQDVGRLLNVIRKLQEQGNSVLVVEHDANAMRAADHIIELGPGAGAQGGQILAQGTWDEVIGSPLSVTADFLSGKRQAAVPSRRARPDESRSIHLSECQGRNLKGISVDFPLHCLVAVSGVSGSGKSTLVTQTLVPALINLLRKRDRLPGNERVSQPFDQLLGWESLQRVMLVDQRPLGDSSRGCPATVLGLMEPLRDLFAATKQAKQLGFRRGRFSFNNRSGWCPQCRGLGQQRIKMDFVPDVFVNCDACQGRRYNLQTLQVKFKGKSIADVLALTADQAVVFFENLERISHSLVAMVDVGLGYLQLGQSLHSLSGGELKRLKIASELTSNSNLSAALIVMDEPTTGLHFTDVHRLLTALNKLIDRGHSLIVIEHNLDLIQSADWIIELGPEGGSGGGQLLFSGTLGDLLSQANTPTANSLVASHALHEDP